MTSGVSFQPGSQSYGTQGGAKPSSPQGAVQEAIKVLSLRLPRVVGATALAPSPLLTSQGSGGNPRVDSIVNQIWARMFPNEAVPESAPAPAPEIPVIGQPQPGVSNTMPIPPPTMPTFGGAVDRRDFAGRPPGISTPPPGLAPIPRFVPGDEPMVPKDESMPPPDPFAWLGDLLNPPSEPPPPYSI